MPLPDRQPREPMTARGLSFRAGYALCVGAALALAQTPADGAEPTSTAQTGEGVRTPADGTDVTVRGSPITRGLMDATAASSSVTGEALRAPGTSSADVLGRVPGVQISRTGGASDLATAAIRGATSAQTPVYLAGVRLNDDVTGTADLSTLPLFLLERVEIYRGNAPIEADRLGIGGAVFFEPRLPRREELSAGVTLGSFGERSGVVTLGVGSPKAAALVAVEHARADNDFAFAGNAGVRRTRTNADYSATTIWGIGRYRWASGARIVTLVHGYDREQGSPGLALVPDDRARTESRRLLAAVNTHVPCSAPREGESRCTLDFVTSFLRATSSLTDPLLEVIPSPASWSEGDRVEQSARFSYATSERLSVAASAAVGRERIHVGAAGADSIDSARLSIRPAVNATLRPTSWAEVSGLVSAEDHETTSSVATAPNSHVFEPGGRLGVRARLTNAVEARANLGYYGRAPTLGELHGVSASVHGNSALHPETGDTADAGIRLSWAEPIRFDAEIFGFARQTSDLITYRQSGPVAIAPFNVGSARILGVESAVGMEAVRHLRGTLSATFMDPRDTTQERSIRNDILPYRSRFVATSFIETFTDDGVPALKLSRAAVGLRLTHRASKYADTAGLIVIGEQTVVDIESTLSFLKGALSLRFALRNAFDEREFDAIGLPLPGRSAYISLEGRLE